MRKKGLSCGVKLKQKAGSPYIIKMKRIIFLFLILFLSLKSEDSLNVRTFTCWSFSSSRPLITFRDTIAYIGLASGFLILNISNPSQPVKIAEYITHGAIRDIVVKDTFLYCADGVNGLRVFNLQNFQEIGRLRGIVNSEYPGYKCIYIQDTLAFVVNGASYVDTLEIIDIRNPQNLRRLGKCGFFGWANDIFVIANRCYVSAGPGGLKIFDVSNPFSPSLIGEWRMGKGEVIRVVVKDSLAYIGNYDTLQILNISNPSNIREVGKVSVLLPPNEEVEIANIAMKETLLYVSARQTPTLCLINVSNPTSPYVAYYTPLEKNYHAIYFEIRDNLLFGLAYFKGLTIYDISNPLDWQVVTRFNLPGSKITQIKVKDSLAIIGLEQQGLLILDFTNPSSVQIKGWFPKLFEYDTIIGGFDGIAIKDTFIFAGNLGKNLLYVLNFANPCSIFLVATCSVGPSQLYTGIRSLLLKDTLLYIGLAPSLYQGIVIYNVKNPLEPRPVSYINLRNVDISGLFILGNYLYAACGCGGFWIIDIQDPLNPIPRGHIPPLQIEYYVGDVWVVDTLAFLAEDWGGLGVVNVKNPNSPFRVCQHPSVRGQQLLSIQIEGNLAFIANGFAGLRIWDISNPLSPIEVGYYDTPGVAARVLYNNGIIHLNDYTHGYKAFVYYGTDIKEKKRNKLPLKYLFTFGKNFKIDSQFGFLSFQIYDIQGRLITKETLNKEKSIIFLDNKPSGIYFILIKKDRHLILQKIIKK